MPRPIKFTTLPEQQRAANRSLDREKKILAGCLIGAAFVFFRWSSYPGFWQLMIASLAFAAVIAVHIRQFGVTGFLKLLLTVVLLIVGGYFLVNGVLTLYIMAL